MNETYIHVGTFELGPGRGVARRVVMMMVRRGDGVRTHRDAIKLAVGRVRFCDGRR